jgi:hypothetical protein
MAGPEQTSASQKDVDGDVGDKGLLTAPPTEPISLRHHDGAADGITNGTDYQTRRSLPLSSQQLFLMS